MRQTIKRSLESMGYETIYPCANGREAWEFLEHKHIDLILSDLNMPIMTGQALLEKVRTHPKLRHIPFIMLTAEGERDQVMTAIKAGVTEFIVKPFTPNALEQKIQKSLLGRKPNLKKPTESASPLKAAENDVVSDTPVKVSNETILVVDDSPDNIDVIANLLKPLYKVKAATSGEKAISMALSKNPPSLILLDIMMPEMDGYEVCQTLKEEPKCADIPIIFLSAKGEVNDITKGFELGAVDYVTKPIEPEILIARIKTHLALRRSKLDLSHQLDDMVEMARLKDDVDRIMQHDMKNPLSAITTHIDLLANDPNYNHQQKEQLSTIQRSANQALNMVSSAMDLYKMETGNYYFKPRDINIVDVLKQVLRDLNETAKSHMVVFEVRIFSNHCYVRGEETLCYSTLCNLIRNAIEASPENGQVRVAVEEQEKGIAIRIYNQGVVDPSIRDMLFDKYVTANKDNGTGLGTYSAMMMTMMQEGQLTFETINEKSTLFSLVLTRPSRSKH